MLVTCPKFVLIYDETSRELSGGKLTHGTIP